MSKEYMVKVGLNYYLIDLSLDEGYVFSEYGRGCNRVSAKYVLSICSFNAMIPVNIFSILHDSMTNMSEVYYQGYKCLLKENAISIFKKIPKVFDKATFIPFRILREEQEGLSQILVPFKNNSVSFDMLNEVYGNMDWEECGR